MYELVWSSDAGVNAVSEILKHQNQSINIVVKYNKVTNFPVKTTKSGTLTDVTRGTRPLQDWPTRYCVWLMWLMCLIWFSLLNFITWKPSASRRSSLLENKSSFLTTKRRKKIFKKRNMNCPKDPKGLSSRFSIAWWFCHFLKPQMRWCSLSGGRRSKWRRLERRDEEENWNCMKALLTYYSQSTAAINIISWSPLEIRTRQ